MENKHLCGAFNSLLDPVSSDSECSSRESYNLSTDRISRTKEQNHTSYTIHVEKAAASLIRLHLSGSSIQSTPASCLPRLQRAPMQHTGLPVRHDMGFKYLAQGHLRRDVIIYNIKEGQAIILFEACSYAGS